MPTKALAANPSPTLQSGGLFSATEYGEDCILEAVEDGNAFKKMDGYHRREDNL